MQLVLLQAGGRSFAAGAMAGVDEPGIWCLGGGQAPDDVPTQAPCPCATFCAAQAAAGQLIIPAGDGIFLTVSTPADTMPPLLIADLRLPRRPPPRPGPTRGPPSV